jgi:hypothetical protein
LDWVGLIPISVLMNIFFLSKHEEM